jgi:phytoene dehydrogenase-like protein
MPLRSANIIGSGPNGLAAAITLAQRGVAVTVYERNALPGGACSTAEVTLPGFHHDLGSSAYPLGFASPFFKSLPLEQHGLRWIHSPAAVAHPLDDGTAVTLESLDATTAQLSRADAIAWRALLGPTVRNWCGLVEDVTQPLLRIPKHLLAMARFGPPALLPATILARTLFRDERARALFAGCAAHSVLPLSSLASSAPGLVLAAAGHATGWPIAEGGAQSITNALVSYLQSLGGRIETGNEIRDYALFQRLQPADVTLFDTSVTALARIAGPALSSRYTRRLSRFQAGPGIFKLDLALSQPIPWAAAACERAATVHLGGTLDEIAQSERDACRLDGRGKPSDKPYVLVVQPSLFDSSRAPAGKHTAWAYCHVPVGSTSDRSEAILNQLERFAPGVRDCILALRASGSGELAAWNPNLVGGDVSGGAMTLSQLIARPTLRGCRTSNPSIYICSSSSPPGGGVHGMCGNIAAVAAYHDHR